MPQTPLWSAEKHPAMLRARSTAHQGINQCNDAPRGHRRPYAYEADRRRQSVLLCTRAIARLLSTTGLRSDRTVHGVVSL